MESAGVTSRSTNAVVSLLQVEREWTSMRLPHLRWHAAVVGVGNLFLGAYFEAGLRHDAEGSMLALYLLVQVIIQLTLLAVWYKGSLAPIIRRVRSLPVGFWPVFLLALRSSLRAPTVLALIASNVLFLVVCFHRTALALIVAPLLYTCVAVAVLAATSVISTTATRSVAFLPRFLGAVTLSALAVVGFAALFGYSSILGAVPVLSWAANGVLAARTGELGSAGMNLLYILGLTGGLVLLARRLR